MREITKIVVQKKNKERYSIFIDGEYSFGVYESVLIKYNLRKGMKIEEDFLEDVLKKEEQETANNYALRLLSFKMRTEEEVRRKLSEKGYEEEVVENAICYLKNFNYLDDREYARAFIKDRASLKNMGAERIKRELYLKGVDPEITKSEIEDLIDRDCEFEKALELAKRKIETSYKNDDKDARYRKLGGFLQRRGYSMDTVMKILREVID